LRDSVIPENTKVILSIRLIHDSDDSFPDAASFNPDRFVGGVPKPTARVPFGGGVNRCVGAAFADMEMDVTLRILLREFRFTPTDAPDERRFWRGIATQPAQGARAVVYRRTAKALRDADSALVADHSTR
jgi:cytochrome P450